MIEPHDELGDGSGKHEELYVVMTGRAEFELDGETHDAPAGTLVFARPEQHRGAKARRGRHDDPRDRRQAGRRRPAVAVRVLVPGRARLPGRDYDRAYAIASEGLEHHADNGPLHYQLGCYRALAGRREEALEHLRRALELSPEKVRRWAADDSDIDSVRADLGL